MPFDRCRALGVPLTVVPSTGSTNADLLADVERTDHLAVLATLDQTAGRGRLDRVWVAPPGRTLAASVLVRSLLTPQARGWLPLAAGAAMREAVVAILPSAPEGPTSVVPSAVGESDVTVKWPNDVLVGGRKVCGILAQVASDGSVVVGAGVNLTLSADELPTPVATSLVLAGASGDADALADAVLAVFWARFREAVAGLVAGGPAAEAVRSGVRTACGTIGRRVRVELPGGVVVERTATSVDDDGRLVVTDEFGEDTAIAVGDVTHLRYA